MLTIKVSDHIKNSCPDFVGAAIFATVQNSQYNKALWVEIGNYIEDHKSKYTIEDIKKDKAIAATREGYKALGKDPNRYRPSSESLRRRILRDLSLYEVNTLVDSINLVSMQSGYSIGGFDRDKIVGDTLTLGVGKANEPYEGIGKGILNIEGLPVYRDELGGVGTPTSDNERTKLALETTRLLTIINSYSGKDGLEEAVESMISLLKEFSSGQDIEVMYF